MGNCLWITTAIAVSTEEVSVICDFDVVGDVVDMGADGVIVGEELGDAEGVEARPFGCLVAELGVWLEPVSVPAR
jgi:hypothetical protein